MRVDSVQVVANRAPEKAIDRLTDFIFYNLHPELNRRKIRSDETQYINEWASIKKVVSNDNLVYQDACGRNSTNYDWLPSKYDGEGGGREGRTISLSSPVLDSRSRCCILYPPSRIGLPQDTVFRKVLGLASGRLNGGRSGKLHFCN